MSSLISEDLDKKICEHEEDPHHCRAARETLEEALSYQLLELAEGLLAHLALRSHVSKEIWAKHHLTRSLFLEAASSKSDFPDVSEYPQWFAAEIAAGRIRPLSPRNLGKVTIRIFEESVKLWDDDRINRQLRSLGSSRRFVFVGSTRLLANQVREFLGRSSDFSVDPRFLFGSVAPLSAWPLGPVYNFETEFAASPFLDVQGAGFNYENRIVIRQPILRSLVGDGSAAQFHALSTLIHEMAHVTGFRAPYPRSYLEASWEEDTIADLCRFTEIPRSLDEISSAFLLNFNSPILADVNKTLECDHFPPVPLTIQSMLDRLRNADLICDDEDGKIRCQKYEKGKQWSV